MCLWEDIHNQDEDQDKYCFCSSCFAKITSENFEKKKFIQNLITPIDEAMNKSKLFYNK